MRNDGEMSCYENRRRSRMALSNCVQTAARVAIRDAVRALTGVVFSGGNRLAFKGHPAISALVAQVAQSRDKLCDVTRRRILTKLKSRLYGVRADLCSRRHHANTSELQRLGSDLLYRSLFVDLS